MLYVTTRDNQETFTSYRTLCQNTALDGGQFVPFSLPEFDERELSQMSCMGFGDIVAEILNRFFAARLVGSDIDFSIGRNAAKLISMNHKIFVCELWHNPHGKFSYTLNKLYGKLTNDNPPWEKPTNWFVAAVRIAVLFGCYGDLLANAMLAPQQQFDICVSSDNSSELLAAWYAKRMGLPIKKIICTTNDSSSLWEFIHRGTFAPSTTDINVEAGLETIISATLGLEEAKNFAHACEKLCAYSVCAEQLPLLNDGLFCSVSSQNRIESTINSVFRSNGYIIGNNAAFCYGGLQDYRAKTGDSRMTLLFAEYNPMDDADVICSATGLEKRKLMEQMNLA